METLRLLVNVPLSDSSILSLDFCKGFGYAKTFSVFQHETDRCALRWPVKTFEIFTMCGNNIQVQEVG